MTVNIHIHVDGSSVDVLEQIMATQAELAQQLTDLGTQLGSVAAEVTKIGGESATLIQKIADLEAALVAAGSVTPELQAAFDAVKAQAQALATQVQTVDDLVPDAPTP